MLESWRAALATLALATAVACRAGSEPGDEPTAEVGLAASSPRDPSAASVALLATDPDGAETRLYWIDGAARSLPPPSARFEHVRGAMVRGALLPGAARRVAVVADAATPRDRSFAAALTVLEEDGQARRLVERVVHASRPWPASDGSILVSRGEPLAEQAGGRVDALTLDAVDPDTGAVRTLASFEGLVCFIVGELDGAAIVYVVEPTGAALVAIEVASGRQRRVAEIPPFARDLSLDARRRAVVLTDRAEGERRGWQVLRVDLASGAREVLHESPSMVLVPNVLADGELSIHERGRSRRLGGGELPLPGPGVLRVQGRSDDGQLLAGLVTVEGAIGVPVLLRGDGSDARALPQPSGARVTVAGVLAGGAR